jgi:type I restriction enzyme, S subunit
MEPGKPLMDEPYPLPAEWRWEPLEALAEVRTGVAKGRVLGNSDTVQVPYLRVANVQNGYLDLGEVKTIEIRHSEIDRYSLKPNDILFTEGGDRDKLGRGAVWKGEIECCVHQNHVFAARLRTRNVLPVWVSLASQAQYARDYFMAVARQTVNLASINATKLRSFPVPVPPIHEQHRLLAKHERLTSESRNARKALDRVLVLLKRFRQAVLAAAFRGELTERAGNGEPAEALLARQNRAREPRAVGVGRLQHLPAGWAWAQFGDLLTELKNGYFSKAPALEPLGTPILRISAVRPMSVSFDDLRYLPGIEAETLSRYRLNNGDLLFTRYNGSLELVGVCGMVRGVSPDVIYPDKLIRARALTDIVLPEYLELYFATRTPRDIIEDKAKSSAGQQGVSGKDLKAVPVALAPLQEQNRIVARVRALFAHAERIERAAGMAQLRAERIDQAMLARAFRGEL